MTTQPPMTIHERVAAVLNWSVRDVQSFPLVSLRDLVRPLDVKLAAEMDQIVRSGYTILQPEKW